MCAVNCGSAVYIAFVTADWACGNYGVCETMRNIHNINMYGGVCASVQYWFTTLVNLPPFPCFFSQSFYWSFSLHSITPPPPPPPPPPPVSKHKLSWGSWVSILEWRAVSSVFICWVKLLLLGQLLAKVGKWVIVKEAVILIPTYTLRTCPFLLSYYFYVKQLALSVMLWKFNEKHINFLLLSNTRVLSSTVQLKYFLCWEWFVANAGYSPKFYEYFYTLPVMLFVITFGAYLWSVVGPLNTLPEQWRASEIASVRLWD